MSAEPTASELREEAPARTPQQARSWATRRRLLDAAVGALVDHGYARATTTEMCRRAGVSQGALFKHFPDKQALLAATVEHLFTRLIADYRRAFAAGLAGEGDRVGLAVRLLWRTFREPRLQAAFELYVAARTDAALRRVLAPVLARHRANLRQVAHELFPAARDPHFEAVLDTVLAAMQGAVLGGLLFADGEAAAAPLELLERIVRRELAPEEGA